MESIVFSATLRAGQLLQTPAAFGRQAVSFRPSVHHIVGVPLGVNAIDSSTSARVMIEGEHSPLRERRNELNGEKRIAPVFSVHQLRQRRGARRRAAKSIRNQTARVLTARGASVMPLSSRRRL